MRIYDCILLHDELDVLEARMEALEGVPGLMHIVCESSVTSDGEPKPLHFQMERYSRFAKWNGRWNHVIVEPHEITGDTVPEREESLREYILHGFHGDPQDMLFLGDLGEFPDPGILEEIARRKAEPPGEMKCRRDIATMTELRGNG
jgi:hypothetical protein